jgi:hypothetical protein
LRSEDSGESSIRKSGKLYYAALAKGATKSPLELAMPVYSVALDRWATEVS